MPRLTLALVIVLAASGAARADNILRVGTIQMDRPTLTSLGVQVLITNDDNFNSHISVRYKVAGTNTYRDALPLWRVHPENVVGRTVQPQFAGSIFGLRPGTTYNIELHAVDPEGTDLTMVVNGTTRSVPVASPPSPHMVTVTTAAELQTALDAAQAGDVITLAAGTYAGNFNIHASGTEANPIVIRGASQANVILDGQNCTACNVLEVYGSFNHVENLTIRNASRALRFQGQTAQGNVVRRVLIQDVVLGIGSQPDQLDFYICDNVLVGRLQWPLTYATDNPMGQHANDDGIHVEGFGHVICHNTISGFGDAMKTEQVGARAVDFYGNDVLFTYDNGIELDTSEGNTRALYNRFTNTYATLSFQPIFGGPAYAIRNVLVNVANEQLKFHSLGGTEEPSGMLVYHNTFVSPAPPDALDLQTTATSHHFVLENNLVIGPASASRVVDWEGPVDDGLFDYNGYLGSGSFRWNIGGSLMNFADFAAVQAAGLETHGVLLTQSPFAATIVPPPDYTTKLDPADVSLAAGSGAVDKGIVLANINDGFKGAAPDLGALEVGCAVPIYGPRPDGTDETNEPMPFDCSNSTGTGGSGGGTGGSGGTGTGGAGGSGTGGAGGAGTGSTEGGCGCHVGGRPAAPALLLIAIYFLARRKRR
jgi:MYXO-CTERM domain-containing protein